MGIACCLIYLPVKISEFFLHLYIALSCPFQALCVCRQRRMSCYGRKIYTSGSFRRPTPTTFRGGGGVSGFTFRVFCRRFDVAMSFPSTLLSFVGGIVSFSSTILAINGYFASTLLDSWAVSSSFCCLIDFQRRKAGTPIQRHNGFLFCFCSSLDFYDLRLRREFLNNCTIPVLNTPFGRGGLVFAASTFYCAPS